MSGMFFARLWLEPDSNSRRCFMLIRPMQHNWELGKWLAAVVLAATLTLLFASALAARL